MSPVIMKTIGAVLLALGVMLAASAAVQFGATDYELATQAGQQAFSGGPATVDSPVDAGRRVAEWRDEHLLQLLAGLFLIVAGAVLARMADGRSREISLTSGGSVNWTQTMGRLREEANRFLDALSADEPDLDAIRGEIGHVSQNVLDPAIASRHELELRLGLAAYAAVMGPLSGYERALNRAWTALADHHRSEAIASLELALAQLTEAEKALQTHTER